MAESDIPLAVLLLLLCEFFVGAIVGASIGKHRPTKMNGMWIAMALGLLVFVYAIIVGTLATPRFQNDPELIIGRVLGVVIFSLTIGFCFWGICVLAACAGYWSAFFLFRRLGIGPNRITLASVFAFLTIVAAVSSLATIRHH